MSGSVNKVVLVGRLGSDPEVASLNNGGKVVKLSVATSERWTDKQTGEPRERTEWHRVVIFNEHIGRIAEQYLRKGGQVYLEGQIQTRKWQDQSGADRWTTEIVLQRYRGELTLLGGRGDGEQWAASQTSDRGQIPDSPASASSDKSAPARSDKPAPASPDKPAPAAPTGNDFNDDIPF